MLGQGKDGNGDVRTLSNGPRMSEGCVYGTWTMWASFSQLPSCGSKCSFSRLHLTQAPFRSASALEYTAKLLSCTPGGQEVSPSIPTCCHLAGASPSKELPAVKSSRGPLI